MKNRSFNSNRIKLLAKMVLFVLLMTSVFVLPACNMTSEQNGVDLLKKFNLDEGPIEFLTMGNINLSGTGKEVWGSSFMLSGDVYEDKESYSRPYISYSTTINNSDLGDGRTFYEKYIKKYMSFSGSPKYSMKISVVSFAFQGEIEETKYEFDPCCSKGERIRIYNGDECVATMTVTTTLDMPNEFYTEILDKSLFIISADKYLVAKLGNNPPNQDKILIEPDLDLVKLSYLSIRNANDSEKDMKTNAYKSYFTGGYSSVYWQTGYEDVVNNVQIECFDSSLNANFEINAEFYEYREQMGKIDYVFTKDEENGNCVELYSHSILVGKVLYSSDLKIGEEWMVDFLNKNLVVISAQK